MNDAIPPDIDWPARIAAYLDKLPHDGWTRDNDLRLMRQFGAGKPIAALRDMPDRPGTRLARVLALVDVAHDDDGILTFAGMNALMDELRRRANG